MKIELSKLSSSNLLSKALKPFGNRKAALEEGSAGISLTTSIIVTLIGLSIMLGLFSLFLNSAKEMQNKEKELRQKENDSISFNVIEDVDYILPDGFVINSPNC